MGDEKPVQETKPARQRTVVVIGDGDLSDETARALEAAKARVVRFEQPDEDDIREALEQGQVESVAVVARTDAIVLRMALMVRAVSDDVPLLLTIFNPTMAEQVARVVANTRVTSLADIVAPSLAGPCIDERYAAVTIENGKPVGLVERDGGVEEEPITKPRAAPRRGAAARALHAL